MTKRAYHPLVRLSHWLTIPILAGLIMTGLAIYWASPVYPPGLSAWIYDHLSFGRFQLAASLNVHWLFAYAFMLCGFLYALGLAFGGGWRELVPRRGDVTGALRMAGYYLRLVPRPSSATPYNPLQRAAYLSILLSGLLALASGWAMHKPVQLWWLERLFGSYDGARRVHYWTMWVFVLFVVPHVVLVIASGWETFRSMVTGSATATNHGRRDFLFFGAAALAVVGGFWTLLPAAFKRRVFPSFDRLDSLQARKGALDAVLTFDDDIAEALYSPSRSVRTYSRHDVTPLRNNYSGRTPGPEYLDTWKLTLSGLASGGDFELDELVLRTFPFREQVTRLCCVEGWSAIAWWGGLRFADLLEAFPPASGAKWAAIESAVSLDGRGRPDPYYVSIDLATARHAQTLLATHYAGRPLTLEHGAPLRLVAPMKLGLKNIKAITSITYTVDEPRDYWAERGYSRYDGL